MIEYCLILYLKCQTLECYYEHGNIAIVTLDSEVFKNKRECVNASYKVSKNYGSLCYSRQKLAGYNCAYSHGEDYPWAVNEK